MSKKRPTESSWDSDEELLSDTSGIAAFPKNSSELDLLAADGELEDEDALLSIDEANAKGVGASFANDATHAHSSGQSSSFDAAANAGQQDVGVDEQAFVFEEEDTGDLDAELDVQVEEDASYQNQQYAEDINYEESYEDGGDVAAADGYHRGESGEGIAYTGENVAYQETDPSMQQYNQEGEVDPNYVVPQSEEEATVELTYDQPEEQEEQVHLEYGDNEAPVEDAVEGSETERHFESESDSDDESGRHNRGKFTTERTGTISLATSKERSSIPDTLELDKEQAEQIDKFMADKSQGGGKKSSRGRSGVHSRLGPRHATSGGQGPRLMHPGPNAGPNFSMSVPGPFSPRMLMGLIRGGAQVLRGLLPAQLLNSRGPMAHPLARALGQRGPFPEGVPGQRGPMPMGAGDPRGPFPRHPPHLMDHHMRGPMRPGPRPGPHLGPHGMGDRGPLSPRMPDGPFPGPMNPRLPPPGQMRMMGPRGPGGPPMPDCPRRMLGPHPMGRGGPRFGGDAMPGPQQMRGLMNNPRGPMPNQPPIRPLLPNAAQLRPGIRNQGPQGPASQGGSRGVSVHERLGPRGSKGKSVPPLMGIDASRPAGQKSNPKSDHGQPIPSLVKSATPSVPQGPGNRPVRPQGPRFGNPDQMRQLQQKGPRNLMPPDAMMGQGQQSRHKIYINPRFQGQQNQGAKQPLGLTRTVRFGAPLQQRKARALVEKAMQNKNQPGFGPRGPFNLKRRSTGSDDVPTKFIRTVGQSNFGQMGAQPTHAGKDGGKFKAMMEEQKRKQDLIIKRKELSRQKQAAEKHKVLVGLDGQSTPPQHKGKPVMQSQNNPMQRLGPSVTSRLGPPINRLARPPPAAPPGSSRNVISGSGIRGSFQQAHPRFPGPLNQRGPQPARPPVPSMANPVFRPPTLQASRPPGTMSISANQFSIPPPTSASRYQTPPPRMNTAPAVRPPINVQTAPPRYQAPLHQASPYQTPPPSSAPSYPPPPVQATTPYPQTPPASAPPSAHYPPPTQQPPPTHPPPNHPPPTHPPPSHPPPSHPPPASPIYQPPHTTYQPPQPVHQPAPTHYQPAAAPAPAAQTPSYPPPAAQPAPTDYTASYAAPASHYATTPVRQEPQQQYYDYSTGTYYPTTTHTTTTSQTYPYTAGQTQTPSSSYYDYSASASQHNPAYTAGNQQTHDQRSVQHQTSVGQPIQTIGRRVQPATGSQMRTIVHNVTTSSSGTSHSSQSGRVVVDTNVSVLPGPQKVSVYNVAKQATKETLLKVCRHFGRVMSIQFMREQDRAIIQFETGEQAAKCVSKCDQKCLLKTRLTVKLLPN